MEETKKSPNKGLLVLLIILVLGAFAYVIVLQSRLTREKKESAEIQVLLEDQKVSLEEDLTQLKNEFGLLQTNNDSMKLLAADQQQKIEQLLQVQADNFQKIKMYQKELSTLRGVLKSYIAQVDSLNTRNVQLVSEKAVLSTQLAQEKMQTQQLSEEKQQLSTTVQKAQALMISPVNTHGETSRASETDRVRRIEKLKTCFTVRANQIAEAGERVFYVVIKLPGGKVLTNVSSATFFADGREHIFTSRRVIDYQNKDVEVCVFSEAADQLIAGTYTVEVYADGYKLGDASFELR
jgi:hypothetical protein